MNSLADKSYLPEKRGSLRGHWQLNRTAGCLCSATGGNGWKGVWGRIELKRGKGLPATLPLLPSPTRPQLQIGEAAIPMVIDPATLPCLDDSCADAGQVQGSKCDDQQKAFKGLSRGEFTALELEAPRFLV